MLDAEWIEAVSRRGGAVADLVARWRGLEERRKELQGSLDQLRAERNAANQKMAALDKKSPEFAAERDRLRELGGRIKGSEEGLGTLEEEATQLSLVIPNAPHKSVPDGADETGNRLESTWGTKPTYDFPPKQHFEIGEALGIMDFERGAKISGARFTVLRADGAQLTRALMNFMIDLHVSRGYVEMWPPVLIKRHALEGTGQLPKFADDLFRIANEGDLFLSPTAEVQLTNLHRDEILEGDDLPLNYCAYAPCFRAEAGSYGKDTRGFIRQHQFDKVELVKITAPEHSYDELELMREDAEWVLRKLGLHYRVVCQSAGDMGFASAKTYDLEVWLPGQDAFREISSVSNCEDFQARRAKIRYRPAAGDKPRAVHTLNGSGLAIGRTIVAILEQFQRKDGTVSIPEVLRPYMQGQDVLFRPGQ